MCRGLLARYGAGLETFRALAPNSLWPLGAAWVQIPLPALKEKHAPISMAQMNFAFFFIGIKIQLFENDLIEDRKILEVNH